MSGLIWVQVFNKWQVTTEGKIIKFVCVYVSVGCEKDGEKIKGQEKYWIEKDRKDSDVNKNHKNFWLYVTNMFRSLDRSV